MKRINFNMKEHGFAGYLSLPQKDATHGVIVVMGGEQSMLPGSMIADKFADYGIMALAVSLFGAEGLPDGAVQIPIDMFIPAVRVSLERGCKSISTYGMSMGSIFAALIPKYIGGIDNVILCSCTHVPFEGSLDKKSSSGKSIATWKGKDIPFIKVNYTSRKMTKYYYDDRAERKVMGMWISYRDAYENKEQETKVALKLYETGCRILLIDGEKDEAWPSDYSSIYIKKQLDEVHYDKDYKLCIYPNASHLIGVMPDRKRERKLYRLMPLIGIVYRSFGKNKADCLKAMEQSEKEIMDWIL